MGNGVLHACPYSTADRVAAPEPPPTVFAIAALGITAIVFLVPGPIPWLLRRRALVRVLPARHHRDQASAAITMAATTGVRTLDEPNRSTVDDALDLVRMDDDGGWQMTRPSA